MQKGANVFREKLKLSAMKEIRNLVIKNNCFRELDCDLLTQEIKDEASPLLAFIVIKRNGDIKSREIADRSCQKPYADKADCTSLTLDFYLIKLVSAVAVIEERESGTVNFPGFFSQTGVNKDKELIIIS